MRFQELLSRAQFEPELRAEIAAILVAQGRLQEAVEQWDILLARQPDEPNALHEKGLLLRRLGNVAQAVEYLERAVCGAPDDAILANDLAVMLSDAGRRDDALVQFERALALYPGNIHIEHQIRRLRAEIVPFWHIAMMNDHRRNDAFEAAIKAAIESAGPDAVLLDIGTGSGLLSLMAARAGATRVTACETVPVIARTARQIVAHNGYSDRVTVVEKISTALEVGVDIPSRARIMVSEILSSDLLTEKILDAFEDAHRRLLAEDAIIIPRAASAIGCLVASPTLSQYAHVGEVSGFDLSPFNPLGPLRLPIHGTMTDWRRLSPDVELVSIDLMQQSHSADLRHLAIPVTQDGEAIGLVQWMRIDLGAGIFFANHPDEYTDGGWLQVLHRFPHPVPVRAGEVLDLAVGHDRTTLILAPISTRGSESGRVSNQRPL